MVFKSNGPYLQIIQYPLSLSLFLQYLSVDCWIIAESAGENSMWVTLKNDSWAEWQSEGQVSKMYNILIFSVYDIALRLEKMIKNCAVSCFPQARNHTTNTLIPDVVQMELPL